MKTSKVTLLLTVLIIFMSLPGYPHDRGNGRPRMSVPSREEPQQEQDQQQQQQQAQAQVFDNDYFFDEIWDGMKAGNHIQLAVVAVKAVLLGYTTEGLMTEFLANFEDSRHEEIVTRVTEKKAGLREKYQTLPLSEEALDVLLTGAAILKVIEDLNKTN